MGTPRFEVDSLHGTHCSDLTARFPVDPPHGYKLVSPRVALMCFDVHTRTRCLAYNMMIASCDLR